MINVDPKEVKLYSSKWFDYRRFSTSTANFNFILNFVKENNKILKYLGYSVEESNATNHRLINAIKDNPEANRLMVKLRQLADKHCLKYDDFWKAAFNVLLDSWAPNLGIEGFFKRGIMFFDDPMLQNTIVENTITDVIRFSDDMFFRADNWADHPLQNQYMMHIALQTIQKYPHPRSYGPVLKRFIAGGRLSEDFLKKYIYPALVAVNGEEGVRHVA